MRYLDETSHKAEHKYDIQRLAWLDDHLGGFYLDEIDRTVIDRVKRKKMSEAKPATANRYLALIRNILRRATREWEWLDSMPVIKLAPEDNKRVKWLTHEQARELIEALPENLAQVARFALATGLRESNIRYMEWSQVDLDRKTAWIHPDQAKARKHIAVPLNQDAIAVLKEREGKDAVRVFSVARKVSEHRAWRKAKESLGLDWLRFHDLRHTWASWHAMNGTPLNVLQELGGWSTQAMVQRYAHLAPAHLASFASNSSLKSCDENVTQLRCV